MARQTGIRLRHSAGCSSPGGGDCACKPSWEASVWSARDKKKIRRSFAKLSDAKAWRSDAQVAVRKRTLRAPTPTTVRQAADLWLAGARDGSIRTRAGDLFKPSTIRSYEGALEKRVLREFGAAKLSEIGRIDLQEFADRLLAAGLDPSTIRNSLMPLRAIYRRALARGDVAVNPTSGLELPAVRGRRDRVADPGEARELLAALPDHDRALWATAVYAGLRRGELFALRWEDVDLDARRIQVARSWDVIEGVVAPKSAAGTRAVPVLAVLRTHLLEHRLRTGRGDGLVFGAEGAKPPSYWSLASRAKKAWRDAGLAPILLHECRHSYAALMIAAGVNPKALSTFMGHSSIAITLDRYGHLFPGSEDEAAELADAYLERADPLGLVSVSS